MGLGTNVMNNKSQEVINYLKEQIKIRKKTMNFKERIALRVYIILLSVSYLRKGLRPWSLQFCDELSDVIFESDEDPRYAKMIQIMEQQFA